MYPEAVIFQQDTWFNDSYKGHIEENQFGRSRQAVNRNFSDANQFRRHQVTMNRGYNRFEVLNNESKCPNETNLGTQLENAGVGSQVFQ